MRIIAASIALCFSLTSFGQTFHVTEAKKVFYNNGRKVVEHDSVNLSAVVVVQKRGKIAIHEDDGVGMMYFHQPGTYRLDSAFAREKATSYYIRNDSVYRVLKANNIAHCRERFRCGTCNLYRPAPGNSLDIEPIGQFAVNYLVEVTDPAFRLEWLYPTNAPNKKYFVVVKDMFDENVDLITTSETHVDIDMRKYNSEVIIYRIIANDCVQSTERIIRLKKS